MTDLKIFSKLLTLALAVCIASALFTIGHARPQDKDGLEKAYKFHNPAATDHNSPWITGPHNKRYQFHIGQQSWLSARENCLAQNSDLVTINSTNELNWILDHYKPQFSRTRERQIQVGLLIDHSQTDVGQVNAWRWVDERSFDEKFLNWTPSESLDQASEHGRCALLNVKERRLQEVDCEQDGTPERVYRFICERNNERHVKHELLNNPLLKKLSDILEFFGVSTPTNESQLEVKSSKDYIDTVQSNSTDVEVVSTIGSDSSEESAEDTTTRKSSSKSTTLESSTTSSDESTPSDSTIVESTTVEAESNEQVEDRNEKTGNSPEVETDFQNEAEHGKVAEVSEMVTESDANSSATNFDAVTIGDVIATDAKRQRDNATSGSPQAEDSDLLKTSEATINTTITVANSNTTADDSVTESTTVNADASTSIVAAIENQSNELDSNSNSSDSGAHRQSSSKTSAVAHGSKTFAGEKHSKAAVSRRLQGIAHDENSNPLEHRAIEPEGVNGKPLIFNDGIAADSPQIDTTRTTRADPLESLADTLEHSILSSSDANVSVTTDEKYVAARVGGESASPTKSRIQTLERIITAVQKMIEKPEMISDAAIQSNDNDTTTVAAKVVSDDADDASAVAALNHLNYSMITNDKNDNLGLKISADNNYASENDVAFNLEDDFVEAKEAARRHPGVNSGDFVMRSDADVAGSCGGESSDAKAADKNSEKLRKHSNVQEFVLSLRKYLNADQNSELKKILDEKMSGNETLMQKLEKAAKLTKNDQTTSTQQQQKQQTPTIKGKSEPDEPVQALIKLYEKKFNGEKQAKIDAQIFAELDRLREEERGEEELQDDSVKNIKDEKLAATLKPAENETEMEDAIRQVDKDAIAGETLVGVSAAAVSTNETQDATKSGKLLENPTTTPENAAEKALVNETEKVGGNETATQKIQKSTIANDAEVGNDNLPHNPTKELVDVILHHPTQDLIEAVLKVHDQLNALPSSPLNETVDESGKKLAATDKAKKNLQKPQKKEKSSGEAVVNDQPGQPIETDDPTSVFPRPNFGRLSKVELEELPDAVLAKARVEAERRQVQEAYDAFNANATPINELVRKIQESESAQRIKQAKSLPTLKGKADAHSINKLIEKYIDS